MLAPHLELDVSMIHTLTVAIEDGLLVAALNGDVNEEEYLAARRQLAIKLEEATLNKVLFDLRNCELKISVIQIYSIAASHNLVIPRGTKYAVVYSAKTVAEKDAQFGEDVATNRGASLQVFTDYQLALSWLKS